MNLILKLIVTSFIVTVGLVRRAESVGTYANGDGGSNAGFASVDGTHFVANGKKLCLNGFNAYWLMNEATDPSSRSKVSAAFEQAVKAGMNIARTFGFGDGGPGALQTSPGVYDENVFKGLDFVISEAKRVGLYLTISLVNNWGGGGGRPQYVKWARERGYNLARDDDFYTHPVVKEFYKNQTKAVLTRVNTITKIAYKDDPTIFAWELINEPRSLDDLSGKWLQDWLTEMAAHIKSIDSNHLLEAGLEGFYGTDKLNENPNGYQAGTNFISNNQVPHIDFATIHFYPETWLPNNTTEERTAFVDKWIKVHIQDCADTLKKPLVIDEFGVTSKTPGFSLKMREDYFQKIYDAIYGSASSGGPLVGGIFWQLLSQGMSSMGDGYEVVLEDNPSTANVISQQSHRLSSLS